MHHGGLPGLPPRGAAQSLLKRLSFHSPPTAFVSPSLSERKRLWPILPITRKCMCAIPILCTLEKRKAGEELAKVAIAISGYGKRLFLFCRLFLFFRICYLANV